MAYSNAERQARWREKRAEAAAHLEVNQYRYENQIAKLNNKLKQAKAHITILKKRLEHAHALMLLRNKPSIPRSTFTAIVKCLHPDTSPTLEDRQVACGLFTSYWSETTSKH